MKALIESAWDRRETLSPATAPTELKRAVEDCLDGLETGDMRVAEPLGPPGEWCAGQ